MLAIITLFRQPVERLDTVKSTPCYPVKEFDAFVGAEGIALDAQLGALGWETYGGSTALQHIIVELPEGVHFGHYRPIGANNMRLFGYYGDYKADGNLNMISVRVGKPARVSEYANCAEAFNAAIESGIYFDVPQPGGGRRDERARVLLVGELRDTAHGESWPKGSITLEDMRVARGMTQQQLAEAAGVDVQIVQRIESGEISAYQAGKEARGKIADALGLAWPEELQ